MPIKYKRKTSKRMNLNKKYRIQKNVRSHEKKKKKLEKKQRREGGPGAGTKAKRDPGVPNLYPYKEEMLRQVENARVMQKERSEEAKAARTEARKERKRLEKQQSLEALAAQAAARGVEFDARAAQRDRDDRAGVEVTDASRRAFYREFRKVIDAADVILEVLDARDPMGCRCEEVERLILQKDPSKKIVLVLNKIDLVPRENAETWLQYLRNDFPAIAFKSSTQKQRTNLGRSRDVEDVKSYGGGECLGANTLVALLKNYSRSLNAKTAISVGIIGYPNVGKSSIINSLKRARAVNVGATPGVTRSMQEVHLDKKVKLLDCPGIVFASNDASSLVLRSAVRVDQISDPIGVVTQILDRIPRVQLLSLYHIADFRDVPHFLSLIAAKKGLLGPGGAPRHEDAATSVIQDWNGGRIPFYTTPPAARVRAAIVQNWSSEFRLDDVLDMERREVLSSLPTAASSTQWVAAGEGRTSAVDRGFLGGAAGTVMDTEGGDDADSDQNAFDRIRVDDHSMDTRAHARELRRAAKEKSVLDATETALNPQVNRELRKLAKATRGTMPIPENRSSAFDFARDFVADNDLHSLGSASAFRTTSLKRRHDGNSDEEEDDSDEEDEEDEEDEDEDEEEEEDDDDMDEDDADEDEDEDDELFDVEE
jgi:nuclear GTP-binding protein